MPKISDAGARIIVEETKKATAFILRRLEQDPAFWELVNGPPLWKDTAEMEDDELAWLLLMTAGQWW